MKRKYIVALAAMAVSAALIAPVILALREADRQGFQAEAALALWHARDILHRTDETTHQVADGIAALAKFHAEVPCSPESIGRMREIDLQSGYIQAIGYVSGNRFECSSVSGYDDGFDIGPVEFQTSTGLKVRRNVVFPIVPRQHFIVLEQHGFAVVLHRDLAIDSFTTQADVTLAIIVLAPRGVPAPREVLVVQGRADTRWIDRLGPRMEATFFDADRVVAVARSTRYQTAAVAAIPAARLRARSREIAWRLVPAGAGMGLALAFVIGLLARRRLAMPAAIRAGLRRQQFYVVYQPIVDLHTGQWVGAEALVRWHRPGSGVVSPDGFIPAAEQAGLIVSITDKVLELVCRETGDFLRSRSGFHVAINISAADVHRGDLAGRLRAATLAAGIAPDSLMIEVTERGLLDKEIAGKVLSLLRTEGFPIAIDDFGTGYSSLSYLESLALDYLKIDRAFIEAIGTGAATSQVVQHIIRMASGLGLKMIAEGVENTAQRDFLRSQGVQFAQGWLFGKPMPFSDFMGHMRARPDAR
ncbi:EAL domain-containing protein [Massilia sp. METH4]|uniref:EAL domain-containing protein n=1 Tax=Massilia sp. METH4 TaxID=3123041 RepID=UPI0030D18350